MIAAPQCTCDLAPSCPEHGTRATRDRLLAAKEARDGLRAELGRCREELWQCYLASGADPDGDDGTHLNPGEALSAIREMRQDLDDAQAEGGRYRALALELAEALEPYCDPDNASPPEQMTGLWFRRYDAARAALARARDAGLLPDESEETK